MHRFSLSFLLVALGFLSAGLAQGLRRHTANQAQALRLVTATDRTPGVSQASFTVRGKMREIQSNGIPAHLVGPFPNRGNPNSIRAQDYRFQIPAEPAEAEATSTMPGPFGFALNGVPFDPGAAEFWQGDRGSGWQYEALGGAVPLGLDSNHAHVQPTGAYHYHGLPAGLMKKLGVREGNHSPLVGWAADGFPIFARLGYSDPENAGSAVRELKSSYRLRDGDRPGAPDGPGGTYDGAFVQDYEYVAGSGDLDECNGRFTVTPGFPEGTYAYFLTGDWPVIPRRFRGTPTRLRGAGPPPGGRRGPPPRVEGHPPPRGKGPPPPRPEF